MPSLSPSPIKRPSITQRQSSTASLSSSGKAALKTHRPHVVGGRAHTRNASHGKNLSKLGNANSTTNLVAEVGRNHQRKKSGNTTSPPDSPRLAVKRNSSHVVLPKNHSHANLRKNHSATALARNVSHTTLKRLGLAPPPKKEKENQKKQEIFDLGDPSSDGENVEEEWEDSTTQSPELTRNNSKASTPARVATPSEEPTRQKPPDPLPLYQKRTSSPPLPASVRANNRSLPNLNQQLKFSPLHPKKELKLDPALLHHNPRSSRAPPAMSTISAIANAPHLLRSDSSKSFTHITHDEAISPTSVPTHGAGNSSSADGGVSRFLPSSHPSKLQESVEDGSDYDSPSNFLSNYHPMPPQSPEKSRVNSQKGNLPHLPSRTQQRLELQRRETMRAGGTSATTPPAHSGIGFRLGSAASLHSRSSSRGRNRSIGLEAKAMKRDYDVAIKQLGVIRKFRSPVVESFNRLKRNGVLPKDTGAVTPVGAAAKSRPQSRRGLTANGAVKPGLSRSLEDKKPSPMASRNSSAGRGGRSRLGRQGSHDDIAFSIGRSRASDEEDDAEGEEIDGMSREEAMIRRIWESRDVFERPPSRMSMGIDAEVDVG